MLRWSLSTPSILSRVNQPSRPQDSLNLKHTQNTIVTNVLLEPNKPCVGIGAVQGAAKVLEVHAKELVAALLLCRAQQASAFPEEQTMIGEGNQRWCFSLTNKKLKKVQNSRLIRMTRGCFQLGIHTPRSWAQSWNIWNEKCEHCKQCFVIFYEVKSIVSERWKTRKVSPTNQPTTSLLQFSTPFRFFHIPFGNRSGTRLNLYLLELQVASVHTCASQPEIKKATIKHVGPEKLIQVTMLLSTEFRGKCQ